MGIVGGRGALTAFHKQFVHPGDARSSLMAMRHSWRAYFDFAELTAEPGGKGAVQFVVSGYPDMPASHGQMIVGWHVAAALEAGSTRAESMVVEAPWLGEKRLVHRVSF